MVIYRFRRDRYTQTLGGKGQSECVNLTTSLRMMRMNVTLFVDVFVDFKCFHFRVK